MEATNVEAKIELAKHANSETTPATLIQLAIEQNVDIDKLEKLMQLQERWEAGKAKKEFFDALSTFQSKVPVIEKKRSTNFAAKTGGQVHYKWADLGAITKQIQEPLRDCGLSYRWEFSEDTKITVKCIITHKGGHSEFTTMSGAADTSGTKNSIQSQGSTLTYLQRYTLIGALGISTAQDDVDANKKDPKPIEQKELSTTLQKEITICNTEQELQAVWNKHKDLWADKLFKDAVKLRKAGIESAPVAITDEHRMEIEHEIGVSDDLKALNHVSESYPEIHTDKSLSDIFSKRKVEIIKPKIKK